jgi:hypothetical protein
MSPTRLSLRPPIRLFFIPPRVIPKLPEVGSLPSRLFWRRAFRRVAYFSGSFSAKVSASAAVTPPSPNLPPGSSRHASRRLILLSRSGDSSAARTCVARQSRLVANQTAPRTTRSHSSNDPWRGQPPFGQPARACALRIVKASLTISPRFSILHPVEKLDRLAGLASDLHQVETLDRLASVETLASDLHQVETLDRLASVETLDRLAGLASVETLASVAGPGWPRSRGWTGSRRWPRSLDRLADLHPVETLA